MRFHSVKPTEGWRAFAGEVGIIVIGVLIALAAQQWAEARSWTAKADAARSALRTELADHYEQAVEWRMVAPCIDAQLNALESRVLSKRASLDPAPLYSEDFYGEDPHTFAIRAPSRPYDDSVWLATDGEGVSSFLATEERMELGWHYGQARDTDAQNERIAQLVSQLSILTKPLELDPSVRMALLQQIAEVRGHNRWMTIRTGQLLDHIAKLEMNPPRKRVDAFIAKSNTVRFCQAQRIRMLPVAKALLPAP